MLKKTLVASSIIVLSLLLPALRGLADDLTLTGYSLRNNSIICNLQLMRDGVPPAGRLSQWKRLVG